jgi:hypothetical protein
MLSGWHITLFHPARTGTGKDLRRLILHPHEKHSQEGSAGPQIPRLRSPGFPVELGGAGGAHASLSSASVAGNPGWDDKGEGVLPWGAVC